MSQAQELRESWNEERSSGGERMRAVDALTFGSP
jgi:hypothetical protein